MLVFAAITPHPPLALPSIGKGRIDLFAQTVDALKTLEQECYAAKPDMVIIISPHGPLIAEAFTINMMEHYIADLKDFGDFSTTAKYQGDPMFVVRFKEQVEGTLPVTLVSEERLDYGSYIPLSYLLAHMPHVSIIPIGYSLLPAQDHVHFGKELLKIIQHTTKRIALIASGDLSYHGDKLESSDTSISNENRTHNIDTQITIALRERDIAKLTSILSEAESEKHQACLSRGALILLSCLEHMPAEYIELSYERSLGIGYLVSYYKL